MIKSAALIYLVLIGITTNAQEWETPIIEGYGKIKNFADVAIQPDSTLNYKLVFDLKSGEEREGVNAGLWKIARTVNMLGAAKIPPENIKIVAAIHGEATFTALNQEKFRNKYGKDNPNLELMQLLSDYGVELYVCAQATAAKDIERADMNPYVKSSLSALSVLSNYQLNGYVFMP